MASQMDTLIEQASERVATEGTQANQTDIILAGFGWLATKLGNHRSNGTHREVVLRVGLPAAAMGTGLGTFAWALVDGLVVK